MHIMSFTHSFLTGNGYLICVENRKGQRDLHYRTISEYITDVLGGYRSSK